MSANKKMTLCYFKPPGRAGISRMILAYAGVDFNNKTHSFEEFGKVKASLPYQQFPTLELEDGKVLAQSMTIARYLANRFHLTGHTDMCKAEADEVVDALSDIQTKLFGVVFAEDKKAKLAECMPACEAGLKNLEKRLEARGGQFLAGNCLTWADLMLHNVVVMLCKFGGEAALVGCSKIKDLNERVACIPNVKKYCESIVWGF